MQRTRHRYALLALVPLLLAALPFAAPLAVRAAVTVPTGFSYSDFATGFGGRLTTMTFAPDGRLFVAQKDGAVRVVKNGTLLSQPFLTLTTDTDSERGIEGIAFDPAYASNGFVYVYYTDATTLKNKVSRFTASAANPDVGDPTTEKVIVDGIDSGIYHNGGAIHFGPDGKLYVGTGDATYKPNSQDLSNLNGKILRVNTDGSVPSDNPFVGRANVRPEIWAYGLRNPFTFDFDPGSSRMYINDVGDATWEEIDQGAAGADYGWPICEGACNEAGMTDPIYQYNHNDGPGKSITGAAFYRGTMFPASYRGTYFFGDYVGAYVKSFDPATGVASDFVSGTSYPVDLDVGPDGALYVLSVEAQKVSRIAYGEAAPPPPTDGNVIRNGGFDTSGSAWLTDWQRQVRSPAVATFSSDSTNPGAGAASFRADVSNSSLDWHVQLLQSNVPLVGGASHTLSFMARASSSRNIRVSVQQDSAPYPIYFQQTFAITSAWQRFIVSFTPAKDDAHTVLGFNIGSATGQVWLDDVSLVPQAPSVGTAPVPVIDTPVVGTTYKAGDQISFSGHATDAEDGDLPASALTWEVLFHHDTHTHPFIDPFSGASSGTMTIPDTGETSANTWYRIHLTATDSDGNKVEVTRDITPITAKVTLTTVPAALGLTLDGVPITAPYTFTGVANFKRELGAPTTQTVNGVSYSFVGWSDSGAATHTIATPSTDTTFTATYQPTGGGTTNLFTNGGFENTGSTWLAPWQRQVRSPAAATFTRDTTAPRSGAAALRVDITTASLDWHVQLLRPGISLTAGVPHTLSFYARATTARSVRVSFQRDASPYPIYLNQTFSIGTTWQQYSITFTPTVTDAKSLFALNVASATGSVWLDDFVLSR